MIADDPRERIVKRALLLLHTHGSEGVRLEDSLPGLSVLRLAPSQLADRRLRVGDPRVNLDALIPVINSLQLSLPELDDLRIGGIFDVNRRDAFNGRRGEEENSREKREPSRPYRDIEIPFVVQPYYQCVSGGKTDDEDSGENKAPNGVFAELEQHEHEHENRYG